MHLRAPVAVNNAGAEGTTHACSTPTSRAAVRAEAPEASAHRRGGAIVNVSSIVGSVGMPGASVYAASKPLSASPKRSRRRPLQSDEAKFVTGVLAAAAGYPAQCQNDAARTSWPHLPRGQAVDGSGARVARRQCAGVIPMRCLNTR